MADLALRVGASFTNDIIVVARPVLIDRMQAVWSARDGGRTIGVTGGAIRDRTLGTLQANRLRVLRELRTGPLSMASTVAGGTGKPTMTAGESVIIHAVRRIGGCGERLIHRLPDSSGGIEHT